ncbi:IclR family transcriptional regulator [Pseudothermotoga thermarum]|uniref:Transcriptional regulator, IclR family n=1 Tax=Pseudothermotoga thermarum DSM 5069 TaxID=688269 RepID=F7YTH1_9THEM|nr:IclR family transcriptional regulator [Pseudothermotoga thermarum]AEH51185.1 transcriptional regulator, IclR family [Pseudothermotoga thermarum DSM 5069]
MTIGSVEKALKILEYVISKNGGARIQDVAEYMNITPPAAYKHLETLTKCGYLSKDPYSLKYHASYKIVELGSIILRNVQVGEIAHPFLVDLMERTGMTVHFALKDGFEGVYIDKVESARTIPTVSRIGMRMRLYSTAFGKAILAFMPKEELQEYLSHVTLTKQTPNTITDKSKLLEELEKVRKQGYAVDMEENEPGIACVGAPVFNYTGNVIGAISVTGAASVFSDQLIKVVAQEVMKTAKEISKRLGAKEDVLKQTS